MPAGRLLEGVRKTEQSWLFKMPAHQLHTNWQSLAVKPGREGQPWYTRQVSRQGEDILKVHGQRVIAVAADLESSGRRESAGRRG